MHFALFSRHQIASADPKDLTALTDVERNGINGGIDHDVFFEYRQNPLDKSDHFDPGQFQPQSIEQQYKTGAKQCHHPAHKHVDQTDKSALEQQMQKRKKDVYMKLKNVFGQKKTNV